MKALLIDALGLSALVPIQVYTPSWSGYLALTIWRVDTMLPRVMSTLLFPGDPLKVASYGVTKSVCSNPAVLLLNSHVILGTGAPSDIQEMVPLPPSMIITRESP